jgi:hypothetical protein
VSGDDKDQKAQDPKDDALLNVLTKTEIDKDQVVSMVGGLVGMLGRASGRTGIMMPTAGATSHATAPKKEVQKNIKHISEKLLEATSAESSDCIRNDEHFMQWLQRDGCKLKNFHEELKFARRTTDLAAEHGDFELGLLAAGKAINISTLHAKKDNELLSELYWVQAELLAISDRMDEARASLKQCVRLIAPDATETSDTYVELANQLNESRAKSAQARSNL